jgi:hypothetical protein
MLIIGLDEFLDNLYLITEIAILKGFEVFSVDGSNNFG